MIKQLKKIPFLVSILSVISYLCVFIPPKSFWPAGILTYAIPVLIIINICLIIPLILTKSKKIIWPVLSLIFGYYFIDISYNFPIDVDSKNKGETFTVMSFNAKLFRVSNSYENFSLEMIEWAVNDSSNIKCFQEYSYNRKWKDLNITKKMIENDYNEFVFIGKVPDVDHNSGLAIFSLFPIVNKDSIIFNKNSVNNCIYVDLEINNDTVRVYNVHLSSMKIPVSEYKNTNNIIYKLRGLLYKLKIGSIKRNQEIELLVEHCEKCPYPFVICGDFNETPYSYNYRKLRRYYQNSFESAGSGFGFSSNIGFLFLRIDHHFVNQSINPVIYLVDKTMDISDHFPIKGEYIIK